MKVSLINLAPGVQATGVRVLSSCLQKHGHEVKIIFFGLNKSTLLKYNYDYYYDYTEDELNQLYEVVKDDGLVGISLAAATSRLAYQIADFLNSKDKLVILGGIHPTICPDDCLEHAPYICVGEGEDAVPEFIHALENNQDISSIQNIWVKKDGNIIKNDVRPLIMDLDAYPLPEYNPQNHYILYNSRIITVTEYYNNYYDGRVAVHSERGCPFNCHYCCNKFYTNMYPKWTKIRKRSIPKLLDEMRDIIKHVPNARHIFFSDDDFLIRTKDEIKEFCDTYVKEIKLPFWIQFSPPTFNEEKLNMLIESGLETISIGIQSASPWTNKEIFNRRIRNDIVIRTAYKVRDMIKDKSCKFSSLDIFIVYDVIGSNMFEKSENIFETIQFLEQLPTPYYLNVSHLILFPGTILYERGLKEGLITGYDDAAVYINYGSYAQHMKMKKNKIDRYLTTILSGMDRLVTDKKMGILNRKLLDFLIKPNVISFFHKHSLLVEILKYKFIVFIWLKNYWRTLLKIPLMMILGESRYYRFTDWVRHKLRKS